MCTKALNYKLYQYVCNRWCCHLLYSFWLVGGHMISLGTRNVNGKFMSPPIASLNMEWTSPNTSSRSQLDSKCVLPIRPLLARTECFLQGTMICSHFGVTGKNIINCPVPCCNLHGFHGFQTLRNVAMNPSLFTQNGWQWNTGQAQSNNACNHLVVDSIGTHHLKHTRPKALHTSIKTYTIKPLRLTCYSGGWFM